jgi:hypothetical protein
MYAEKETTKVLALLPSLASTALGSFASKLNPESSLPTVTYRTRAIRLRDARVRAVSKLGSPLI